MHTLRRFGAILATVALLCLAVGVTPVAATTGGCNDANPSIFEGENSLHLWPDNVSGTAADIYTSTTAGAFDLCTHNLGDDALSAWVAIVPQADAPARIIQIGIVRCNFSQLDPRGDACVNSQPRYFWAAAGCGSYLPYANDLGAATLGLHHYEIYNNGAGRMIGTIDGVVRFNLGLDNARFSCWINGLKQSKWLFENNDTGNSIGNASSTSYFDAARYGLFGQGWQIPYFGTGGCYYDAADAVCNKLNPDYFYAYSPTN